MKKYYRKTLFSHKGLDSLIDDINEFYDDYRIVQIIPDKDDFMIYYAVLEIDEEDMNKEGE